MRLLVLGGTAWLSREVAGCAAAADHDVTCLARGQAGPAAAGVRLVPADRDRQDAYEQVTGSAWDAVVDVARQPGHVRRAVAALEPVADRYLFVSSVNVYAGHREPGQDERAPLLAPLGPDVMESMDSYGEAKVACERAVGDRFGADRSLFARAGLIGGPGDPSGRTGYWPWRFAHPSNRGGAVLVPDDPDGQAALIDVRDLAAWLVACAERGVSGAFNAAGEPLPLAEHLAVARTVAGHTGPVVGAPSPWLHENGVQCWSGATSLPLWLDDPDWRGLSVRNTARAREAGLAVRPLAATLADALDWEANRAEPGPHGAGLTDAQERRLLAALAGG